MSKLSSEEIRAAAITAAAMTDKNSTGDRDWDAEYVRRARVFEAYIKGKKDTESGRDE